MSSLPLLRADDSLLLIIDMQTRPAAACAPAVWTAARDRTIALARAATTLGLPVAATRQEASALGNIDPEIARNLPVQAERMDKTRFAATGEPHIEQALAMTGRSQVVVCGMEAHIAVVQTLSGLAALGYRAFAVADAICATDPGETDGALARIRIGGVPSLGAHAAMAEWLRDAAHPQADRLLAPRA